MAKTKPIDIDALVAEAVPPRPNPQLAFMMPVKVVSEANLREHWRTRHGRKKKQQDETVLCWPKLPDSLRFPALVTVKAPCVVRLLRIGPKRLDSDNLAGSFKHVQDQIARLIGIDDGSPLIKWEYEQVAVGKRIYQVRVEVY